MTTYVFNSHDGYGLGHVRRNVLIAEAVRQQDPTARTIVVTGTTATLPWLQAPGLEVVRVPPLLKGEDGRYRNDTFGLARALELRAERFDSLVRAVRPDVVVVDRHPSGIDGELRPGLERSRRQGAATVLGLRDILDEAPAVWAELAGPGWATVGEQYDAVFVYGSRHLCDHEAEYGLPVRPTYVGWVTDDGAAHPGGRGRGRSAARSASGSAIDPHLLVITAGGGGDGEVVARVGVELIRRHTDWHGLLVAGPMAARLAPDGFGGRLQVVRSADSLRPLLARAGASVQMAGYNTTLEALVGGLRPILVPRRAPRREQAIRAARLASLGLADVVDEQADAGELSWLLHRPRRLGDGDVEAAGMRFDGAPQAARLLRSMATRTRRGRGAGRAGAASVATARALRP